MTKKPATKAQKAKAEDTKPKKQPKKAGELTRFQKIVIVVFIVIFAFSTLAGAFASVLSSNNNKDTSDNSVSAIDAKYEPVINDLQAKVDADSSDAASLLALGRYYYQWGYSVKQSGSSDDDTSHANDLFEKAVSAYDKYLESNDSNAARVDRAMVKYAEGDTDSAVSSLQEVTTNSPDYALAWAYLGYLYYYAQGNADEATTALNNAVTNDPNDEYGAKTYANNILSAIQSAQSSSSDSGSSDSSSSDSGSSDSGSSDSGSNDSGSDSNSTDSSSTDSGSTDANTSTDSGSGN